MTADGSTGSNFNRYWYANDNPYRFTDPDGRYGRGTGFDDSQWKRFTKIQQGAAASMEKRAGKLEAKANKLDAQGKTGGETLRTTAGHLREGASALRSDGSDGKVANAVDSATYQSMGGSVTGAAFVKGNGPVMTVNKGNTDAWASGNRISQWSVGHESLHTAGLNDQRGSNGQPAYKFGLPENRESFKEIKDTNKAIINPDHLMELVYPALEP